MARPGIRPARRAPRAVPFVYTGFSPPDIARPGVPGAMTGRGGPPRNRRDPRLPALPLQAWEDTKTTVHLYLQIVGKIRMTMMPRKNHWSNLTLYVSPRGATTHAIPFADGFA